MKLREGVRILLLSFLLSAIGSCGKETEYRGPEYGTLPADRNIPTYTFAVHPLHNPEKMVEAYQPLVDYFNVNLTDAHIVLEASGDHRDIENRYVGSQESSIMNAYMKLTAAGATWPTPWRSFLREHPREAAELAIAWESETLINNSMMAKDKVPSDLRERLQAILIGLHETDAGKTILEGMETSRFFLKADQDYNIVRSYVTRFEKEVRKVR